MGIIILNIIILNGFDWKNENTHPYEYDIECENWEFYPTNGMPNGHMLNCYPEAYYLARMNYF